MFKPCFQRDFGWNRVKICKNTSTFFIFTTVLQIFPIFFSRARSTAGDGGTEKYQPWYQPPYQPSTRVVDRRAGQLYLTWSIRLGQKPSIKGITSISIQMNDSAM